MSVSMRRVEKLQGAAPGDFVLDPPDEFNKGDIFFICPKARECSVGIRNGEAQGGGNIMKRWGFNGNCEKPTLTPSIDCTKPIGCGWHGHITNGEMTNA